MPVALPHISASPHRPLTVREVCAKRAKHRKHPLRAVRLGFTLAELLVALALFALLAVSVGQNINNSLRALAHMDSGGWDGRSMRAIRENILAIESRQTIEDSGEMELAGWPKPGETGATTAAEPVKVRWTAEVNPTGTLDLFAVTVELQLEGSEEEVDAEFVLYVYRKGWDTPEDRERMTEAKQERLDKLRTARGEHLAEDSL